MSFSWDDLKRPIAKDEMEEQDKLAKQGNSSLKMVVRVH
jgi:hypothetical protein